MFSITTSPASRRSSTKNRQDYKRIKREDMDLSSFKGIRRGGKTYINTLRNRSPAGRDPSSPSPFSSSALSSVSSFFSITAQSSLEAVSSSCVDADASLNPVMEKKVRFVHPVVTAVLEPKFQAQQVRFAEPLTNTPLRSEEERADLRLPDPCYANNTGPICEDPPSHYKQQCMCYLGQSAGHADGLEAADFEYSGPLFYDEVSPQPAQNAWKNRGYGLAF